MSCHYNNYTKVSFIVASTVLWKSSNQNYDLPRSMFLHGMLMSPDVETHVHVMYCTCVE